MQLDDYDIFLVQTNCFTCLIHVTTCLNDTLIYLWLIIFNEHVLVDVYYKLMSFLGTVLSKALIQNLCNDYGS